MAGYSCGLRVSGLHPVQVVKAKPASRFPPSAGYYSWWWEGWYHPDFIQFSWPQQTPAFPFLCSLAELVVGESGIQGSVFFKLDVSQKICGWTLSLGTAAQGTAIQAELERERCLLALADLFTLAAIAGSRAVLAVFATWLRKRLP